MRRRLTLSFDDIFGSARGVDRSQVYRFDGTLTSVLEEELPPLTVIHGPQEAREIVALCLAMECVRKGGEGFFIECALTEMHRAFRGNLNEEEQDRFIHFHSGDDIMYEPADMLTRRLRLVTSLLEHAVDMERKTVVVIRDLENMAASTYSNPAALTAHLKDIAVEYGGSIIVCLEQSVASTPYNLQVALQQTERGQDILCSGQEQCTLSVEGTLFLISR
jgi:hypothetical protein